MTEYWISPEAMDAMAKEGREYIERMEQHFKAMRRVMADPDCSHQWIKVSDRLPETDITTVVYDKELGVDVGYFDDLHKEWWQLKVEGDYGDRFNEVTHYMPLPKPPKD